MDLSTTYLGLQLKNPLIASSSPLTGELDTLKQLEDAGAAAVVLPSLFEEQIEHEEMELARLHDHGTDAFAEALNYFPEMEEYNTGPETYLELLSKAKAALEIPVMGSLNGISAGGWLRYAKLMQEAGADALELNVYYLPTDPAASAQAVEARYRELIEGIRAEVTIPFALKVGPFFSALAHMAQMAKTAGADGIVLFNRFMQPDIDLETLAVKPGIELSSSAELTLPLRWIAILSGRVQLSLGATTGVHRADDMLKLLLAGADVTMMASALLKNGPGHIGHTLERAASWMQENEYESIKQLKGSMSQQYSPDPSLFERANYMKGLLSYSPPR